MSGSDVSENVTINDEALHKSQKTVLPAKQTASLAWKYYIKFNDTSAKCSFCNKIIKHSGNTTNLMQHLSRKHEILLLNTNKKKKSHLESSKDSSVNEIQVSKRKKLQV